MTEEKDANNCKYCDLCSKVMGKEHFYHCEECDFDVCTANNCYLKDPNSDPPRTMDPEDCPQIVDFDPNVALNIVPVLKNSASTDITAAGKKLVDKWSIKMSAEVRKI